MILWGKNGLREKASWKSLDAVQQHRCMPMPSGNRPIEPLTMASEEQ